MKNTLYLLSICPSIIAIIFVTFYGCLFCMTYPYLYEILFDVLLLIYKTCDWVVGGVGWGETGVGGWGMFINSLRPRCISNLTIIGSDNGLSPVRRQAIIWTNAGMLLIGPLGTNFSEILIKIHTFPFKKMHLKMSFGRCRPFCLGLNELTLDVHDMEYSCHVGPLTHCGPEIHVSGN